MSFAVCLPSPLAGPCGPWPRFCPGRAVRRWDRWASPSGAVVRRGWWAGLARGIPMQSRFGGGGLDFVLGGGAAKR